MEGINIIWIGVFFLLESIIGLISNINKKVRRIVIKGLWGITILLIIYNALRFLTGKAEVNIQSIGLLIFIVVAEIITMIVFSLLKFDGEDGEEIKVVVPSIIFTQLYIFIFFTMLADSKIVINQTDTIKVNIQYYYMEKLPESKDRGNKTIFRDFYYFSKEDNIQYCYNTNEYEIKLIYDVEKEETEYYNIYYRDKYEIYTGIGVYAQCEVKPLIEFHVYKE